MEHFYRVDSSGADRFRISFWNSEEPNSQHVICLEENVWSLLQGDVDDRWIVDWRYQIGTIRGLAMAGWEQRRREKITADFELCPRLTKKLLNPIWTVTVGLHFKLQLIKHFQTTLIAEPFPDDKLTFSGQSTTFINFYRRSDSSSYCSTSILHRCSRLPTASLFEQQNLLDFHSLSEPQKPNQSKSIIDNYHLYKSRTSSNYTVLFTLTAILKYMRACLN